MRKDPVVVFTVKTKMTSRLFDKLSTIEIEKLLKEIINRGIEHSVGRPFTDVSVSYRDTE